MGVTKELLDIIRKQRANSYLAISTGFIKQAETQAEKLLKEHEPGTEAYNSRIICEIFSGMSAAFKDAAEKIFRGDA